MATVTVTTDALEQLDELPPGILARVELRTGDYRVQFFVQGEDVIVERIGHRDGFYED